MIDLSRILDELFADLKEEQGHALPTLPTSLPTQNSRQTIDIIDTSHISHTSHTSHIENEALGKNECVMPKNTHISPDSARVTSSITKTVGSVGSVGSVAKTLAGSTSPFFPQDLEDVGSVGRESGTCGPALPDLNHVALQRSERLDDATLAAFAPQFVPTLSYGDPLPISPVDVRAGVERELRALAVLGCTGPDALRDAIAITAAKIRNSEVLVERQAHDGRCHACGELLDGTRPEVAILQAKGGGHLWVHAGDCHSEHIRRRAALVKAIMTAAGYGADQQEGEAA